MSASRRTLARWAAGRFGHRGIVLLCLGIIYTVIGLGNIQAPDNLPALQFATKWMPLDCWGWLFIVFGILGVISARIPPGRDAWGFILMSFLSWTWACVYFFGWAIYDVPRAWQLALVFGAFGVILHVVASWPEPKGTR